MLKMISVTPKRTKTMSSSRLRIYAPRPTLFVHLYVFEPIVREAVDEEAIHVLLPPRRRGLIDEEDERCVIQIGLLDRRIICCPLRHVLLQVRRRDLIVESRVVVVRP